MVNAYQGLGHHFKSVPNYLQRKGQVIKITQPKLYLLTHLLRQCQEGIQLKNMTLEEMDKIWDEAKEKGL